VNGRTPRRLWKRRRFFGYVPNERTERVKHHLAMLGASLAMVAAVAHAQQPPGFAIAVQAPPNAGCVDGARLTALVEERAGRPVSRGDASAQLAIDVVIAARAGGYVARVTITDAGARVLGEREIEVEGACEALTDMLTLVIASSVGVSTDMVPAATPPAASPPAPPPEPTASAPLRFAVEPPNAPPVFVAEVPASNPSPSSLPVPWTFQLGAFGRVLTGVAPQPSVAFGLDLFANHAGLSLGASALWLSPLAFGSDELDLRPTGIAGELNACGRAVHEARVALAFCAGFQAGALNAEASRLWRATQRWDALIQLSPSVRARWALSPRFGLGAALAAAIPVLFPRYSYVDAAGESTLYHAVAPGVWAELGIWIRVGS
jgi:hypothetical protein